MMAEPTDGVGGHGQRAGAPGCEAAPRMSASTSARAALSAVAFAHRGESMVLGTQHGRCCKTCKLEQLHQLSLCWTNDGLAGLLKEGVLDIRDGRHALSLAYSPCVGRAGGHKECADVEVLA